MEKYNCKTVPITNLIITPMGPVKPLCNTCCNKDCGNPINKKSVSVYGKIESHRVYEKYENDSRIVIECIGYIPDEKQKQK